MVRPLSAAQELAAAMGAQFERIAREAQYAQNPQAGAASASVADS